MEAVAWLKRLQSLSLSPEEKGEIIQRLFRLFPGKWGEQGIQRFFDSCVECAGERALLAGLRGLLQGADVTEKKTVEIFTPKLDGEVIVPVARSYSFTEAQFERFLPLGSCLLALKGAQHYTPAQAVVYFRELVEGESYVLEDGGGIPLRVKALEKFNASQMQACEDELAGAMVRDLKFFGLAEDPVPRADLRMHCRGSAQEQEFDVVVLDGEHKLFIGSAKHVAHGTSEVEDMLRKVRILAERANSVERFPSYAPFQGRAVGCCIRMDMIKEAHRQDVRHLCFRKGVGLFQRIGAALMMLPQPFAGPLSLEPGFINMAVRGFKRLAR